MEKIIQLTFGQLLEGTSLLIILLGIFQWLLSIWVKARLEKSIQDEYDKQLEEYKFLISKREKIANTASFLARWIKYRGNEEKWLKNMDLVNYYEELTKMSFELVLWIDDENFIKDIMKRTKNENDSIDTLELLLRAKELISGNKNKDLKKENITYWPKDTSFFSKGPKEN